MTKSYTLTGHSSNPPGECLYHVHLFLVDGVEVAIPASSLRKFKALVPDAVRLMPKVFDKNIHPSIAIRLRHKSRWDCHVVYLFSHDGAVKVCKALSRVNPTGYEVDVVANGYVIVTCGQGAIQRVRVAGGWKYNPDSGEIEQ